MAIQPEFEQEDEWEAFLEKSDPRKRVQKKFQNYSWSFGIDEDDDGFTRDCVILEVAAQRDTEPRHVQVKLSSKHLRLSLHGDVLIDDDFSDERWLSVEDSYWELETKTNKAGERIKNIRYLLYLRADCTKYITKTLFETEKKELPDQDDSDDDTADTRIKMIANLKEPEPRREADVYFSEEEEFSEYECEGCGSKSVSVMKKAEDRCFKVYCNDCPYVSVADMNKEAPSIRRQREIDEARARKKKEKEKKKLAEKLAIEDQVPVDLAELEEVD
ncbi:unnamed protein product [Effrenium voratum]|uniref:Uncharacterized protein n=1 Tax=Effrenium voratum TaxID=2562239 RepID=A0AA36NHZ4_9DINO|nr:unnamed protein product [Effrenium voratum]CAJ1407524.1 unnamed protein product [Effrenium voratum]CAJ1436926.1 unnamed protein product [Effrenium voratum]|mmetsp:Transcript_12138/g.28749  ORF Transcript_12138/g.28749 Transcript_12138/m.28749 type:complete len:274 (-) Transcript_12138:17-838(-)